VSASKSVEQLQADESLIVGTAANAVAFDNSTTLTAVTLADGIQAFVAQDIKLDPGRDFFFWGGGAPNICKTPNSTKPQVAFTPH